MAARWIPSGPRRSGRGPAPLAGLLALLAALTAAWLTATGGALPGPRALAAEEPAAAPARWYETLREGQKVGWTKVVWTPSTWRGRATVHDRTEALERSARDMAGHEDVFEQRTQIDLERDADGTLWWQRVEVLEAGRRTVVETTWTGAGYEHVTTVADQREALRIPLDAPVHTDAEALLSEAARRGALAPGQRLALRTLDVRGRRAHVSAVEVLGPDRVEGPEGPVPATKVRVRHPETGSEETLWLDAEGALVRVEGEGGHLLRRASEEAARRLPAEPPSFSITVPAVPVLPRVMSADRHEVEITLAADPARRLPEFPRSPWGTVEAPVAAPDGTTRLRALLTSHDAPGATVALPLDPAPFARELEATALMPVGHARLAEAVAEAAGGSRDARTVAERLARWVHDSLAKASCDVAQASALEILEERRGDCSEHALLYVALCRAAGVPARLCSGYVHIGSDWGSHAWAEVWLGRWVGADPTTGEVGTAARYLFFGYQDAPDSFPAVVTQRIQGRMALRSLALEEDGVRVLLTDDPRAAEEGPEGGGWWRHAPSGLEARGLPAGWSLRARDASRVEVRGPGLRRAWVHVQADQGATLADVPGRRVAFAGQPALSFAQGLGRLWLLHSRRRIVQVRAEAADAEALAALERLLAPSFEPEVSDPRAEPAPGAPADAGWAGRWTLDRERTLTQLAQELLEGLPAVAAERARERLAQRVAALEAELRLAPGGEAVWTLGPDAAEASEPPTRWTAEGEALVVARGERVLARGQRAASDRLVLQAGAWTLVLRRTP